MKQKWPHYDPKSLCNQDTYPGPDGIPVLDPSQTFFKYPTRPSRKLKMTGYRVVSISFLKQQNAAWNGKWQIQLTLTLKIMISSFIEKSDVEQVQIFLLVPLELK